MNGRTGSLTLRSLERAGGGTWREYMVGSPHLKHWWLSEHLTRLLRDQIRAVAERGLPLTLLEVGAGHGGYTEAALASGCSATCTEMSRAALDSLVDRYGTNPRFTACFTPEGSLDVLGEERFSLVVFASVLHHIRDYLGFVQSAVLPHLTAGGTFLSLQDPMWYSRLRPPDRWLSRVAYYSWRVTQGSYREGMRTVVRRVRGTRDEHNPRDTVEYHVVCDGVDEEAITGALAPRFERVSMLAYWSTQSASWQRLGERLGARNTFAIVAEGFGGPDRAAPAGTRDHGKDP